MCLYFCVFANNLQKVRWSLYICDVIWQSIQNTIETIQLNNNPKQSVYGFIEYLEEINSAL